MGCGSTRRNSGEVGVLLAEEVLPDLLSFFTLVVLLPMEGPKNSVAELVLCSLFSVRLVWD